jgi:hypothetical protein
MDDGIEGAQAAWRQLCQRLEATGQRALADVLAPWEPNLAEGLRYLARILCLSLESKLENTDSLHPYLARNIGPIRKMGGDNPLGHYLDTPINGEDRYRIAGKRGSAGWVSFQIHRSQAVVAQGLSIFGGCLFLPDLETDEAGNFEIVVSPQPHPGNWIQSDPHSELLVIRQFFDDETAVRPMDLTIENISRGNLPKRPLTLEDITRKLDEGAAFFQLMVPVMQGMVRSNREHSVNCFETADGAVQSAGGVPGGSPITGYWRLEPDEALVMNVTPPEDCYYWDIQVGNCWYESFDYRHFISGLGGRQLEKNADGSVTLILSEQDPGTVNWLQCAGHTEGHMAIRWQAIAGEPPKPACHRAKLSEISQLAGHLRRVSERERQMQQRARRRAVEQRFRL